VWSSVRPQPRPMIADHRSHLVREDKIVSI
jgi:hypothetical protein